MTDYYQLTKTGAELEALLASAAQCVSCFAVVNPTVFVPAEEVGDYSGVSAWAGVVPDEYRCPGRMLTFAEGGSAVGGYRWELWQYVGRSVEGWEDASNWVRLLTASGNNGGAVEEES